MQNAQKPKTNPSFYLSLQLNHVVVLYSLRDSCESEICFSRKDHVEEPLVVEPFHCLCLTTSQLVYNEIKLKLFFSSLVECFNLNDEF